MIDFFLRPEARPYLESLEQTEPAQALARVKQPVLIIQGGGETSVTEPNAELLLQAQPRARVERFPELNHSYKRAEAGLPPEASFLLDTASDPAVAAAIATWLGNDWHGLQRGSATHPA